MYLSSNNPHTYPGRSIVVDWRLDRPGVRSSRQSKPLSCAIELSRLIWIGFSTRCELSVDLSNHPAARLLNERSVRARHASVDWHALRTTH